MKPIYDLRFAIYPIVVAIGLLASVFILPGQNVSTADGLAAFFPPAVSGGGAVVAGALQLRANEYVDAGSILHWENTQAWSVWAVFRQSFTPGVAAVFIGSAGTAQPFTTPMETFIASDGKIYIRVICGFGTNYLSVHGGTGVCDGNTHTVLCTYDGSKAASGCKIYLDGVPETLTTEANLLTGSSLNSKHLYVGNQDGFTNTFNVDWLGPIQVSTSVRDATYASTYVTTNLFSPNLPPIDANTVLAYSWTNFSGTTANDVSGSGFNGTLADPYLWDLNYKPNTGPVRLVQTKTGSGGSSTSGLVLAYTNSVVSGNLLVARVATYNGNSITVTPTDTQGNTWTQAGTYVANNNNVVSIWKAVASSSGADTVTVTPSAAAYRSVNISEYSGVSSTVESTATGSGTGTPATFNTLTVGGSHRLTVSVIGQAADLTRSLYCNDAVNAFRAQVVGGGLENAGFADCLDAGANFTTSFVLKTPDWAGLTASFTP